MRNFILILSVLIATFFAGYSQEDVNGKVEDIFDDYLYEQGPGLSIAVIKDGETMLNRQFGLANIESGAPVQPDTRFNTGTLTSQFTAMGVMILKDEGKLAYKDKISKYLPGLPDYTKELTVEDLLEESSGLPYFSIQKHGKNYPVTGEVIDFLHTDDALDFQPGKKDAMNPVNTALLTLIIEEVTGVGYHKFIKDKIFDPLGMDDSEVYKGGWFYKIKDKATGYLPAGNEDEIAFEAVPDIEDKNYLRGVTGLYSTPADMLKWLKAWDEDILVEQKTLSGALRIGFIRGAKEFYGYGWRKSFNKGKKYLYQGGTGYGHTHLLLKFPAENIDVIILSNQQSVFGMRAKAFQLLNLFSDEEYEVK